MVSLVTAAPDWDIPCVGDMFLVQFVLIIGPPLLVLAFVLWTA